MATTKVKKICPFCGKETSVEVDAKKWDLVLNGTSVQMAFPELDTANREILISGMCYNCQEDFYNMPAPGHEEAFGKFVGYCPDCECRLYEKDFDASTKMYNCPSCHQSFEQIDALE